MSCSFTEKISSLIDGELAPAEAREVERHLLGCAECEQQRLDFLNLRSQIASFATSTQPLVQNRALRKILSGGRHAPARGLQWNWGTPAIAFAVLLIVGAIFGFIIYKNSNEQEQVAIVHGPSPAPSATPEPSPEPTPEQQPAPKPAPSAPAPAKKPLVREPKPG